MALSHTTHAGSEHGRVWDDPVRAEAPINYRS
jgi:hypothetical protein